VKQEIERLLHEALKKLESKGELLAVPAFLEVEASFNKKHGDYASNIPFILARLAQKKPREIAERIIQELPPSPYVEKVEVAGAGFLNFFLTLDTLQQVVSKILTDKETYGRCKIGRGKRILVEFLSSNPTGPLHVGHGRHAAFGIAVSNLLDAVGFKTYREYYINDVGKQMDILTVSIWFKYLVLCGEEVSLNIKTYTADYVTDIARQIYSSHGLEFHVSTDAIFGYVSADDEEKMLDELSYRAKQVLADKYQTIYNIGLKAILADIREDLMEFGIHFDNWVSERQFIDADIFLKTYSTLKESGHTYEKDGALWFKTTEFGDKKDRVLLRKNGERTYFANDVAYHLTKFDRGFDIAIDIFGPDHHGHTTRMKGALEALNIDPERLVHLLVQFVTLCEKGEHLQMSIRDGHFVTLRDLRKTIGNDAARFFYIMRRNETYMDFDLDLASVKCDDNPVYYIQYAYARICSVFDQLKERDLCFDESSGLSHLHLLVQCEERKLMNTLLLYPDLIIHAALNYGPHELANFLRRLASDFHGYYQKHKILVDDENERNARLALLLATKQTLLNGFNLLGILTPEMM
jgi:arginyl-tRNA synthetase